MLFFCTFDNYFLHKYVHNRSPYSHYIYNVQVSLLSCLYCNYFQPFGSSCLYSKVQPNKNSSGFSVEVHVYVPRIRGRGRKLPTFIVIPRIPWFTLTLSCKKRDKKGGSRRVGWEKNQRSPLLPFAPPLTIVYLYQSLALCVLNIP